MLGVAFLFLRIGMQCLWVTVVGKQADVEGTTLIGNTLYADFPFVQGYEILHQRQSDTGTRSLVFAAFLIIAVEYVGQSLRLDTVSRVADPDFRIVHFGTFHLPDTDADAALFRVL